MPPGISTGILLGAGPHRGLVLPAPPPVVSHGPASPATGPLSPAQAVEALGEIAAATPPLGNPLFAARMGGATVPDGVDGPPAAPPPGPPPTPPPPGNGDGGDSEDPRDYQIEASDSVKGSFLGGEDRALVVLPTGTGKTVFFKNLARDLVLDPERIGEIGGGKSLRIDLLRDRQVLVLTHLEENVDQLVRHFSRVMDPSQISVVQADRKDFSGRVVIATVQTLSAGRNLEKIDPRQFGLIIVDEVHHLMARTWAAIMKHLGFLDELGSIRRREDGFLLGVTATPDRSDGQHLSLIFGPDGLKYTRPLTWFVSRSWLLRPIGIQVYSGGEVDLSQVPLTGKGGDFVEADLAKSVNVRTRNAAIVDAYIRHALGRKMMVFNCGVDATVSLTQMFNERLAAHEIRAEVVHNDVQEGERRMRVEAFRERRMVDGRQTLLMVNHGIFTETFDDPDIEGVIIARPSRSRSLYVQMVGRALRPNPNHPERTSALVIDVVDSLSRDLFQMDLAELFGTVYRDVDVPFDPLATLARIAPKLEQAAAGVADQISPAASAALDEVVDLIGDRGKLGTYLYTMLMTQYQGDVTTFAWQCGIQEDTLTRYLNGYQPDEISELLRDFKGAINRRKMTRDHLTSAWQHDQMRIWFGKAFQFAMTLHASDDGQKLNRDDFMMAVAGHMGLGDLFQLDSRLHEVESVDLSIDRLEKLFALHESDDYTRAAAREDYEKLIVVMEESRLSADIVLARILADQDSDRTFHFPLSDFTHLANFDAAFLLRVFQSRGINTERLEALFLKYRATVLRGNPPHLQEVLSYAQEVDRSMRVTGSWNAFKAQFQREAGLEGGAFNSGRPRDYSEKGKMRWGRLFTDTLLAYADHPDAGKLVEILSKHGVKLSLPRQINVVLTDALAGIEGEVKVLRTLVQTRGEYEAWYAERIEPIIHRVTALFTRLEIKSIAPFLMADRIIASKVAAAFMEKIRAGLTEVSEGTSVSRFYETAASVVGLGVEDFRQWVGYFNELHLEFERVLLEQAAQLLTASMDRNQIAPFPGGSPLAAEGLSNLPPYEKAEAMGGMAAGLSRPQLLEWEALFATQGLKPPWDDLPQILARKVGRLFFRVEEVHQPRSQADGFQKISEGTGLLLDDVRRWVSHASFRGRTALGDGVHTVSSAVGGTIHKWSIREQEDQATAYLEAAFVERGTRFPTPEEIRDELEREATVDVLRFEANFQARVGLPLSQVLAFWGEYCNRFPPISKDRSGLLVGLIARLGEAELNDSNRAYLFTDQVRGALAHSYQYEDEKERKLDRAGRVLFVLRELGLPDEAVLLDKMKGYRAAGLDIDAIETVVFRDLRVKRPEDYPEGRGQIAPAAPRGYLEARGAEVAQKKPRLWGIQRIQDAERAFTDLHKRSPNASADELKALLVPMGFTWEGIGEVVEAIPSRFRVERLSAQKLIARMQRILLWHEETEETVRMMDEVIRVARRESDRAHHIPTERPSKIAEAALQALVAPDLSAVFDKIECLRAKGLGVGDLEAALAEEKVVRPAPLQPPPEKPVVEVNRRPRREWLTEEQQGTLEEQEMQLERLGMLDSPAQEKVRQGRLATVRRFLEERPPSPEMVGKLITNAAAFLETVG